MRCLLFASVAAFAAPVLGFLATASSAAFVVAFLFRLQQHSMGLICSGIFGKYKHTCLRPSISFGEWWPDP